MEKIDLRSDTVTRPTLAMRRAMAEAVVGDDVYGEDPTINELQEKAASLVGMEAGLFVASGTMGNLAAVLTHCGRGDEVIMGNLGHTFLFEAGGIAALGGVHTYTLPNQMDGTLDLVAIEAAIRPDHDPHFPITRLIILENTQNRCGGVVLSADYTQAVASLAHHHGLLLHMDGARIFNAAIALNIPAVELTKAADSVTFCLSKGLCAPVGSVLCGSKEFIYRARRIRKQLGGGMRQAGVLAAAGLVALDQMIDRLAEDHQHARELASLLGEIPEIQIDPGSPATNMIFLELQQDYPNVAKNVAERLAKQDILVGIVGEKRFRLVLHNDIKKTDLTKIADGFLNAVNLN